MTVRTTAGSSLALAPLNSLPATLDQAGYSALTYTIVGEITDLGSFGKKYNVVNHNPIANRQTIKIRGSFNNGTLSIKMGRQLNDLGQQAAKAALTSDQNQTFCMTYQDGSKNYFEGLVTEFSTSLSTVDTVTECMMSVELVSEIVETTS